MNRQNIKHKMTNKKRFESSTSLYDKQQTKARKQARQSKQLAFID